ncbi:hypothetical protein NQ318_023542 [Aromia moschata]|uniref:PiggyBac transposable element-derived protein 4 n=1 Tax=Aromia moschata TaxID=1265417 RepID=A0AAV8YRY5_9CUCU|nr:hypothetical protein NQ318_023542 [Aromia moschata]
MTQLLFQWKQKDLVPCVYQFCDANSGCTVNNLAEEPSILDCFEYLCSTEIVQKIVDEIHLYKDFVSANNLPASSRLKNWKPTNVNEFYVFLAVSLLMIQVKKNRISEYWSKDALIETPIFGQTMSRDRGILILRLLHFGDNINMDSNDKFFKIRIIIDNFRNTFKSVDCETGYLLDFIVYTGATTEIATFDENLGKSGNIVMTLTEKYWGKGHVLYTDNWYSSPLLFEKLLEKKLIVVELLKLTGDKLEKGEVQYLSTGKLLALKWQDKREVRMSSCLHNKSMTNVTRAGTEEIEKRKCIVNYNQNMGVQPRTSVTRPMSGHYPPRLIERHFPSMYPRLQRNNKHVSKRCVVCSTHKIRRETSYTCQKCNVPLCVVGCFPLKVTALNINFKYFPKA